MPVPLLTPVLLVSSLLCSDPDEVAAACAGARLPATEAELPATEAEIAAVVADFTSEDRAKQEKAANMLRRLPVRVAGPLLMKPLQSEEARTRRQSLRLLRSIGYKRAASRITRLLGTDPDHRVRCEASHALAALHPDRAVSSLRNAALGDLEVKVRRAAILDLGDTRTPEALDALIDILEVVVDAKDEYLIDITHRGLTYCTGKRFGTNIEGWRHFARTFKGYGVKDDEEEE